MFSVKMTNDAQKSYDSVANVLNAGRDTHHEAFGGAFSNSLIFDTLKEKIRVRKENCKRWLENLESFEKEVMKEQIGSLMASLSEAEKKVYLAMLNE